MPLIDGRHLILYKSTTTSVLGALLAQNDNDGREKFITSTTSLWDTSSTIVALNVPSL